jgi:hypothetical protein
MDYILKNGERHDLHDSAYVIIVIKYRRVKWVGHLLCVCMEELRNTYKLSWEMGKEEFVGRCRHLCHNHIRDAC